MPFKLPWEGITKWLFPWIVIKNPVTFHIIIKKTPPCFVIQSHTYWVQTVLIFYTICLKLGKSGMSHLMFLTGRFFPPPFLLFLSISVAKANVLNSPLYHFFHTPNQPLCYYSGHGFLCLKFIIKIREPSTTKIALEIPFLFMDFAQEQIHPSQSIMVNIEDWWLIPNGCHELS